MLWWKYQQLRIGSAKSRLSVVERLAISGDESAVGPLIFALKDKDTAVRCTAAKALMPFHDRRAVEPLIKLLRDTEPLARAAAAETLGQLGDPLAVNHLVGFLRDSDPTVRTIVARSLERLGWRPGTDSQRVMQILAMGRLHQLVALGPEGVSPLIDLLRNGSPSKQFSAVKSLGEITDPRVYPAMIEALGKPSPAVRIAALGVLERLEEPAAYSHVEKQLHDANPSVRGAAVEAATRCGGARAVPAVIKCLKDLSWEVRQAAAGALGRLGEPSAVEPLCELISDPDRDVRETTIHALAQIRDRRAILPLVLGLLDPETIVRAAAAAALDTLDRHWANHEEIHKVAPKIVKALSHPDYWVRLSAGKLLERLRIDPNHMPEPADVKPEAASAPAEPVAANPTLAILADLLFDRDRDLRLAGAEAFGRLRDKSAAALLTAALRDTDFSVRETAQAALAAINAASQPV
jgi:HEAT repeat protein